MKKFLAVMLVALSGVALADAPKVANNIEGAAEILSALSPEERALNAGTAAYGQGLYRFEMNGLMLGAPLFGGEAGFHDEGNGMFWMPISIVPVGR